MAGVFQKLKVLQDVDTRWNSALAMIRRLLKIMPAIAQVLYSQKSTDLLPSAEETKDMELLEMLLTPYEDATKMMSSEKHPTISLILPLWHILQTNAEPVTSDPVIIRRAKEAMKKDLEKRYKDPDVVNLLGKASMLDPRFKSLHWMKQEEKERIRMLIREEAVAISEGEPLEKLAPEIVVKREQSSPVKEEKADEANPPLPSLADLGGDDMEDERGPEVVEGAPPKKRKQGFFDVIFVKEEKPNQESRVDLELRNYMAEENAPETTGPLDWWQIRKPMYPILTKLVMKFLCVPGTSVPSERVFSAAGNLVTKKRAALSKENVNILLFMNKNKNVD